MVRKLLKYINQREVNVFANKIAQAGIYLGGQLQFNLDVDQTIKAKEVVRMVALKRFDIEESDNVVQLEQSNAAKGSVSPSYSYTDDSQDATTVAAEPAPMPKLTPMQQAILKAKAKRLEELAKEEEIEKVARDPNQLRLDMLARLNKEFAIYEQEMLLKEEVQSKPDAIKYWKENLYQYPTLGPAALDLICCPMTEVSVERLFSHMSYVLSPLRNRLTGDILQDILFLRVNNRFSSIVSFATEAADFGDDEE